MLIVENIDVIELLGEARKKPHIPSNPKQL